MPLGFGSTVTLYTFCRPGEEPDAWMKPDNTPVRIVRDIPAGPDYDWWPAYLREEWERRALRKSVRHWAAATVVADQRWERAKRFMDAEDAALRPSGERHALWGSA